MNILSRLGNRQLRCIPCVKRQFVFLQAQSFLKHSGVEKNISAISELIKVNTKSIKEEKTGSNFDKISQKNMDGVLGKNIKPETKKLTKQASSETTSESQYSPIEKSTMG